METIDDRVNETLLSMWRLADRGGGHNTVGVCGRGVGVVREAVWAGWYLGREEATLEASQPNICFVCSRLCNKCSLCWACNTQ